MSKDTRALPRPIRFLKLDPYHLLLLLAMVGYVLLFTKLAWDQHTGMRTHKADLGQIDQAVWNSSRGRFVENSDNGFLATRMTDHVEPILALVSPIFWVWDDVRALLLLQVMAVAVGAWPLYALARTRLHSIAASGARPLALGIALAYLLMPQLQSALLTEFHAAPLAVPLILWAFWAIERRRWGQFVIATVLVALVKEEMALLAAGLGVWGITNYELRITIDDLRLTRSRGGGVSLSRYLAGSHLISALLVVLGSLAWFYVATLPVTARWVIHH